jgi:hypothetical protein
MCAIPKIQVETLEALLKRAADCQTAVSVSWATSCARSGRRVILRVKDSTRREYRE